MTTEIDEDEFRRSIRATDRFQGIADDFLESVRTGEISMLCKSRGTFFAARALRSSFTVALKLNRDIV